MIKVVKFLQVRFSQFFNRKKYEKKNIIENTTEDAERSIDGLEKNYGIVTMCGIGFNFLIMITVIGILISPNGETAILACRIFGLVGVALMIISTFRMIKSFNDSKNKVFDDTEKSMPIIMGFFVSFMTIISLYGYFSKVSKLIIFWNYDFILHYDHQILELILDAIYIPFVCIFLITQLLFLLIVAPVTGIENFDTWLFCTNLFVNTLQKWLYESTVVHMELCQEFNKNGELCSKYMHYQTSFENLTKAEEEHYYSINELEPFTYTVTMELFIAYIGLILCFQKCISKDPETLPFIQEEIKPHSKFSFLIITISFAAIILCPLYVIITAPIINVIPGCTGLCYSRTIIRFVTHLANSVLLWNMMKLLKIPFKFKGASEADIIILWVTGSINAIKAFGKFAINCTFVCRYMTCIEWIWFGIAQIGNSLESLSFYFIILVIERLLLIAKQPDNANTRRHLSKFMQIFLPLYFCATLIGFAAYYNLNSLHFFPSEVTTAIGVNLIVFLQATYPTTMLFTMTVCLCLASIMEKLYQKNYYRLKNNLQL